jgi:hypothetical protein
VCRTVGLVVRKAFAKESAQLAQRGGVVGWHS